MAGENQQKGNPIASNDKYLITCPYCFNETGEVNGEFNKPFSHTEVEFRAETFFQNESDIEQKLGTNRVEIDMMADANEQKRLIAEFDKAERFMLKTDEKYQDFWDNYEGQTTEQDERMSNGIHQWERPVIKMGDGIKQLIADKDGFVTSAIDSYGRITDRRVCPHCHNPLPVGFGKNRVKNISIIGTTGAGKTVYISQLLYGMGKYARKSGLSAFFTSPNEANFVEANKVAKDYPLPDSTSPGRLSQPMFYDIVQSNGMSRREDTIVLYDIAGENCKDSGSMIRFAKFVKHSDGLILLIDPEQLNFIPNVNAREDNVAPSTALNTLHAVLESEGHKKSTIPIAVCVSKSDQCFNILPPIAQEQVQSADEDVNGMPKKEFDGRSYNQLQLDLKELLKSNADEVHQILGDEYLVSNFFAVSAIGCKCEKNEKGFTAPINVPNPRRIEEPILWLFKQFGMIKSNAKVKRAFKIPHARRYIYKKPLFGKATLEAKPQDYSEFEEDVVRKEPEVWKRNEWVVPGDDDDVRRLINELGE